MVFVPEHQVRVAKASYIDQVEWEWEGLENCSCVAFWVPREIEKMPAFTTNVEFGSYIRSERSVYGRPDSASKCRYLDWLYLKTRGLIPENSLKTTLEKAIKAARRQQERAEARIEHLQTQLEN